MSNDEQIQGGESFPIPQKQKINNVQNVIAISSAKGGVGKSTLSVNLAFALKALGHSVGILDADIYGPSIPTMLGVNEEPKSDSLGRIIPIMCEHVPLMSIGFLVKDDQPLVWRGPMLHQVLQQFFHEVRWVPYSQNMDYLIIDLPPGTGDIQLSMAQQVEVAGAVIVTTPQDVALADVKRGIKLFNMVDVPIMGVVENMSYFCCPHCNERTDIFSTGGAESVVLKAEVPLLGEIPLVPEIRECGDNGRPIMLANPDSPQSKQYLAIAEKLHAAIQAKDNKS
ncbi:MAG: Mrp/NBP35 family ATP-binding protein [Magnetococcales bacterium]|nr:Mrp/NBP35 family ATP-binding protein [Magnetococcales bacterium]